MDNQLTDQMFHQALFNEDDMGSVIRAHLHIEFHVNEILGLMVPYPENLKPMGLEYHDKVHLICALGVKEECKPSLLALGNMRNKFAHNPFFKLGKSEVNNLYNALSADDKQTLHQAHEMTNEQHNTQAGAYKSLSPRDQFILIVVLMRQIVIIVKNELSTNHA